MLFKQNTMSMRQYVKKMKGSGRSPMRIHLGDSITALVGSFISILTLMYLTKVTGTQWLMASFGASCVLAFGLWNAPLSQPRNIVGGHMISTMIGLIAYYALGNAPWVIALAVSVSIAAMMLTKMTHPPAGANPIIVMIGGYGVEFLFSPVLIGALIIVLLAIIINNLHPTRNYPTFWL